MIEGDPHCSVCGWELEKVTFAWQGGEYTAVLCKNPQCPRSQPLGA